jgi:thioredoxin reductase (NADPH)
MFDVIVIGSGPAGYTAAIYSSRAFLKTLIISGTAVGGQLTTTTTIENFPGFPDGVLGPELMEKMKKQSEKYGTEIVLDTVLRITNKVLSINNVKNSNNKPIFTVTGNSKEYQSKAVIIATGACAKTLGLPTEERFRGKGISYCATCDGFFYRGKNIAVLGGGDTAMEEATFLTKFADHVTIIHRREEFRASAIMLDKARKNPKISFLLNKAVEEFEGDTSLKTIKLKDVKTGKVEDVKFDGVFVAIGHQPATDFLKEFIEIDNKGYIITRDRLAHDYLYGASVSKEKLDKISQKTEQYLTSTSVDGVFAAGDCVDSRYRQGIVAAGMGAMAAIDVDKWLEM